MKVLQLSKSDLFGGAARSAFRLHEGLRGIGVDSSMLVAQRVSLDKQVAELQVSKMFAQRVQRRMLRWRIERELGPYNQSRPTYYEPFHTDRSKYALEWTKLPLSADLINLHWVSEFVDYAALLPRAAAQLPLVWTLHDMNPFTGGCHYDHDCGRYRANCGFCPQLGSAKFNDLSRRTWLRKRTVFARIAPSRLHIVTPSRWLKAAAKASPLLAMFDVSVIPYGLDTDTFCPRDKADSRRQLGLPLDANIILFVAHSSDIRRKGFDLLADALAGLRSIPQLLLLTIGEGGSNNLDLPEVRLGRVDEDERLAVAYAAADVFVIPSREDNLPNTVLESLSCGTPVVGFAVGGIPEMVSNGYTGNLAATDDAIGLRNALRDLLENPALRLAMSENCRKEAVSKYRLDIQAHEYRKLYESLVPHLK